MKQALLKIFIFSLFLTSCSPEAKLKRAQKQLYNLLKEHHELSRHDTIYKTISVLTPVAKHDTIFKTQITKDTIIIKDKQLTIKYYNDGKTTYLKGVCDTIRITKEVPTYITTISPAKEIHVVKWYDYFAYVISILALIFLGLDLWATIKGK